MAGNFSIIHRQMGRKKPEDQPLGAQMEFGFQAPPPPELIPDPEIERRRVDQVLYDQHAAHVDGRGGRTTEVNGGRSTMLNTRGGTQVSSSPCGERGDVYQFEPLARPPDITLGQAARIGLISPQPKTPTSPASPGPIQGFHDLIGHYQPGEVTDEVAARMLKMAEAVKAVIRR